LYGDGRWLGRVRGKTKRRETVDKKNGLGASDAKRRKIKDGGEEDKSMKRGAGLVDVGLIGVPRGRKGGFGQDGRLLEAKAGEGERQKGLVDSRVWF
jgi:hypothetical protein